MNQEKMKYTSIEIPFTLIDWSSVPKIEKPGEEGKSIQQVIQFAGLRMRMVEYTAGYFANHWCQKGHIVYCVEGSFVSEMENGVTYSLSEGMSYIVSDNMSSHRSKTKNGVKLLIIDGDFLKEVSSK
jgi:hypothetical protein